MKIVLIHPPHPNSTDDRLDPPLGLLYISSYLKQYGINVEIKDLSEKYLSTEHSIFKNKSSKILDIDCIPFADIYGIVVYISSIDITKQIVSFCRSINPNCKIVVGGAHPSSCPYDFPYVDHVVVGAGEVAMYDIITGVIQAHIIIGTEPDNYFLFPSYDLIDPHSYHRKIEGNISLPILTSRYCPFKCSFCGLSKMHKLGNTVRMDSPENVYYNIKRIKDDFGIDRINFQDDIFTLNPDRLFKILDLIKPLNIKFRCMGRAGYDTEQTYEKLSEAGCSDIAWGIESGSQYILDRMNKQVKVRDNYNVIQWAKKYGITSRAFFIIGFPGETVNTIEDTKKFIELSDPDQYFVSSFIPYPGTDVGDNPSKYGIINKSLDYNQYFQISKNGLGGLTIDTEWLSKNDFRDLEIQFREWINKREMRGSLQDYEKEKIWKN